MFVQLLPLGIFGHPIWASAQAALNSSVLGSISGDLGATALGAGRYLAAVAIVFAASAVTVDRRRAATLLYLLVGMAIIWVVIVVVDNAHYFFGSSSHLEQLNTAAGARSVFVLGLAFRNACLARCRASGAASPCRKLQSRANVRYCRGGDRPFCLRHAHGLLRSNANNLRWVARYCDSWVCRRASAIDVGDCGAPSCFAGRR